MRVLVEECSLRGVAQMVARTVRDREVVGSNPAAPIFFFVKRLISLLLTCSNTSALPRRFAQYTSQVSRLEIRRFSLKNAALTKAARPAGNFRQEFYRKANSAAPIFFFVKRLISLLLTCSNTSALPRRFAQYTSQVSRLEIRRFSLKNAALTKTARSFFVRNRP